MTTEELELAIRDSVQMESAKTWRDLEYICRNIEARHRVEGISEADLAAYANVKEQHKQRVLRAVLV